MTQSELLAYYAALKQADAGLSLRAAVYSVPKGRPRFSGKGHTYTPEATREFEGVIRALAQSKKWKAYSCPVTVTIVIQVATPTSYDPVKTVMAMLGLITPPRGDLDNRVKAITDALNGIAYYDDVQITRTISEKVFGSTNLISVEISRAGLSDMEIDRFKKMQKVAHVSRNSGRSNSVG